ncbi:MAG: DUF3857 and transglutaminase domain-containing protein [Kiloniellales bacterium]|nr:DUF3857 and transglutaminase domain-containing protein [Kiloniellales bacterium]
MRRQLRILVLLASALLAGDAAAGNAQRLTSGGQPVDFALWSPQPPGFAFEDLALGEARRDALEHEGIDYAVRLFRAEIHLRADGDVEETRTTVRLLLSQAAIRRHGDDDAWVDAYSQTATIREAYSLLPSGERIEVEPATIQVTPDDEDRIFSDEFQMIVPFAGLVPGAMTVLAVHSRHRSRDFPLPWSRIFWPQITRPSERFEVVVTWDAGVTPPKWRSDMPDLTCEEEGRRRLVCGASEVPAFKTDPDILYRDTMPTLVIAEAITWSELVRREIELFNRALEDSAALDRAVARLTEGAEGAEERLARIHAFVAQEVRYLGLEHGLGGIIPRPTHRTLSRRFGDCKDKTALFVDLVRRAGIEAFPVLTSTRRENVGKLLLPASSYFNHMVACARLPDAEGGPEREICVDLTDPYSAYSVPYRSVQGAIRLDIRPESRAPGQMPAADYGWVLTVASNNVLTPEGSFEKDATRTFAGMNAAWLRTRLQTRNPEERQEWLTEDFRDIHTDAVDLISVATEGVERLTDEVTIRTKSVYAESFDPEDLSSFSHWETEMFNEARNFRTGNENHPYAFPGLRYHGVNRYTLPEGHRVVHAGARIDFDSAFGRLTRSYRIEGQSLEVTTELRMPRQRIPTESIPSFNAFIEHITDHAKIAFDIAKE